MWEVATRAYKASGAEDLLIRVARARIDVSRVPCKSPQNRSQSILQALGSSNNNNNSSSSSSNARNSDDKAVVNFIISFSLSTTDSNDIGIQAGAIFNTLNASISSGSYTSILRKNAIENKDTHLQYAYVSFAQITRRVVPVFLRTNRPSRQPTVNSGADALSAASQSGIIAGSVVAGTLAIFWVVLLVLYLRRQILPKSPRGKSVAFEFPNEYPNESGNVNSTAMTAETRRMLQRIKLQREQANIESTRAVFDNAALNSIVVNRDHGLYAEGINTKLVSQLADLSVDEVGSLILSLQMSDYKNQFTSLGITGRVLAEIETVEDLMACDVQMPKPVARAFIKAVGEYRLKGVPKTLLKSEQSL